MEFIEFLWKDADSNVGNCPSLSKARDGGRDGYIVVGKQADMQIPAMSEDEIAVFVPANVIDRIRDLA